MSGQRNYLGYGNYGAPKRMSYARPRSSLSAPNQPQANLQAVEYVPSIVEYVPHVMEYGRQTEHGHGHRLGHQGSALLGHNNYSMVTNNDGATSLVSPRAQGPVFKMNRSVYEGAEGQRITNETYEYQMANDAVSDQSFPAAMRNLFMMSPYQGSTKGVARGANVRDVTEEEDEY